MCDPTDPLASSSSDTIPAGSSHNHPQAKPGIIFWLVRLLVMHRESLLREKAFVCGCARCLEEEDRSSVDHEAEKVMMEGNHIWRVTNPDLACSADSDCVQASSGWFHLFVCAATVRWAGSGESFVPSANTDASLALLSSSWETGMFVPGGCSVSRAR